MTLAEIKQAVDAGKSVCWKNDGYVVMKDSIGQYLIMHIYNFNAIGLTWVDGATMNGKPEEFYLKD